MALCRVIFTGTVGQSRTELEDAASLYAAADGAVRNICRMWWFDPGDVIMVKVLKPAAEYRTKLAKVQKWRAGR